RVLFRSITMPIGMVLLTAGLFLWHREQLVLNEHLRKREQLFREHHLSDDLMYLGRADFLHQQLQQFQHRQPVMLVLMELTDAANWPRHLGITDADRLLRETAEVLPITMPRQDPPRVHVGA